MANKVSKRQQKQKELVLEQLRKVPIVQACCDRIGISRATYYRWHKEDKSFSKEAEKAISEGVQLVNELAESKVIAGIQDNNTTMCIFWLKNRHNAYRDKLQLSANKPKEEALSKEEQKLVERALKLIKSNQQKK